MVRGKKHTAEQVVNLLRQVEVGVANGKLMAQRARKLRLWNRRTIVGARSTVG
jgi:putative transposase